MLHVYTTDSVRALDAACDREANIPTIELMENAARSAADIILDLFDERKKILVVCGNGNNGGDGFAIARMLSEEHDVTVVADPTPDKMSEATRRNFELVAESLGFAALTFAGEVLEGQEIVIDAAFGVGFHGSLGDANFELLGDVGDVYRIAVDIPSGLDANTGIADEYAFQADLTITMEGVKLGMLCGEGQELCGEVLVASIGAPEELVKRFAIASVIEPEDVRQILPQRKPESSKFDYGRVLVVAGSLGMRGAAALTSSAAMRGGAGLVELATPYVHPLVLREVMTTVLPSSSKGTIDATAASLLTERMSKASVLALGPGIGDDALTIEMLAGFINNIDTSTPIVIDADGLRTVPLLKRNMRNVVLTPHHGEYAHLCSDRANLDELKPEERIAHVKRTAKELGCILHVKSHPSITTDGETVYLTTSGNPGMATAGSGDVLTGLIAACLAQHVSPLQAAALAAYFHAEAGDIAAETKGEESMIAGDIIEYLAEAIGE